MEVKAEGSGIKKGKPVIVERSDENGNKIIKERRLESM